MSSYEFKPDGIHLCEPKIYHIKQVLKNVTVEILTDNEGKQSIGWYMQDDTEDITEEWK